MQTGLAGMAGVALYAGEFARHELEVNRREVFLADLPDAFDGYNIVQLSDIHMDEFTEPFFLRQVVTRLNQMRPDLVVLTGDFVTHGFARRRFAVGAAWQCANILNEIECRQRIAVLGNHDIAVGERPVTAALRANDIPLLRNSCIPVERDRGRIWLAGLDDPVTGRPNPDLAIPRSIRNLRTEPVLVLCHAPDYVDTLLADPVGSSIALMLSGHTHGGQVRLPLFGALQLPDGGKKYAEGMFRFGKLQLYVNRGIGCVGLPFRLNCPPEITSIILRTGRTTTLNLPFGTAH
jgi:predicted MPP superfamily phosphohydrolase